MSGLLRADWIRLRRRRDLLIISLAVPVLVALTFVSGYLNQSNQVLPVDPEMPLPPEQIAQFDLLLQRFSFPQSLLTVLGSSGLALVALAFLGAATMGDEFGWSTIRLSLLAASDRLRFLASRLLSLGLVGLWLIGILIALGFVLPLVLTAMGNVMPPAPGIEPLGTLGYVAALLAVAAAAMTFGVLLALLTRSGPAAIVIAVIYALLEGSIGSLPAWERTDALGWVPHLLFMRSAVGVLDQGNRWAAAVRPFAAFEEPVTDAHVLPVHLGIAVVLAWTGLFVAMAFVRIQRMDISE